MNLLSAYLARLLRVNGRQSVSGNSDFYLESVDDRQAAARRVKRLAKSLTTMGVGSRYGVHRKLIHGTWQIFLEDTKSSEPVPVSLVPRLWRIMRQSHQDD